MQTSALSWIVVFCACATSSDLTSATSYGDMGALPDSFLRQVMARLNDDLGPDLDGMDHGAGAGPSPIDSIDDAEDDLGDEASSIRVAKDFPRQPSFRIRHDGSQNFLGPSLRDQEYLQHSSLWGHQYMQGGAGEGNQHLKPDGSVKNAQSIKTDSVLPAYCNPPNPCPLGYTAADGCLEEFTNTAAFSREYQASQECMCDAEHMFDCPSEGGSSKDDSHQSSRDSEMEIDALARSMQHEELVDSTLNRLVDKIEGEHKSLVAKKFFNSKEKKSYGRALPRDAQNLDDAKNASQEQTKIKVNPYLVGEKLPVVAKKGYAG